MFELLKNIFSSEKVDLKPILDKGAVIIDVRTPAEYQGGHIKKSVNIPLQSIGGNIKKIKKMNKPVVTCCASGMRSNQAMSALKAQGIEAYNGGGWQQLNRIVNS